MFPNEHSILIHGLELASGLLMGHMLGKHVCSHVEGEAEKVEKIDKIDYLGQFTWTCLIK